MKDLRAMAVAKEVRDRFACNECEFVGTAEDHSREEDCCSMCGGNVPYGGEDKCTHCGCIGYACPQCGARYSPWPHDDDDGEPA